MWKEFLIKAINPILVGRFIWEMIKWALTGFKLRTKQQVEHLFDQCYECPHFNRFTEIEGECSACGCIGRRYKCFPSPNFIEIGSKKCPLKIWREA